MPYRLFIGLYLTDFKPKYGGDTSFKPDENATPMDADDFESMEGGVASSNRTPKKVLQTQIPSLLSKKRRSPFAEHNYSPKAG